MQIFHSYFVKIITIWEYWKYSNVTKPIFRSKFSYRDKRNLWQVLIPIFCSNTIWEFWKYHWVVVMQIFHSYFVKIITIWEYWKYSNVTKPIFRSKFSYRDLVRSTLRELRGNNICPLFLIFGKLSRYRKPAIINNIPILEIFNFQLVHDYINNFFFFFSKSWPSHCYCKPWSTIVTILLYLFHASLKAIFKVQCTPCGQESLNLSSDFKPYTSIFWIIHQLWCHGKIGNIWLFCLKMLLVAVWILIYVSIWYKSIFNINKQMATVSKLSFYWYSTELETGKKFP